MAARAEFHSEREKNARHEAERALRVEVERIAALESRVAASDAAVDALRRQVREAEQRATAAEAAAAAAATAAAASLKSGGSESGEGLRRRAPGASESPSASSDASGNLSSPQSASATSASSSSSASTSPSPTLPPPLGTSPSERAALLQRSATGLVLEPDAKSAGMRLSFVQLLLLAAVCFVLGQLFSRTAGGASSDAAAAAP